MIVKKKKEFKKWTIPCIIILIIISVIGGGLYFYYSAPQRVIKKYLKNRFIYSYSNIENNLLKRNDLLSTEYIKETENNGVVENFLHEVRENQYTSQLGDYNIKFVDKTEHGYIYIVTATSYIQDATNNVIKNNMTGFFTVKRYNLWTCLIINIESLSNDDSDHDHNSHNH